MGSWNVFAVNEHDLESRRQTLEERSTSSPLSKRKWLLVGTHNEDVLENFIAEVSEIKKQIERYKKMVFCHKFSLPLLESIDETLLWCISKHVPPRTLVVSYQAFSIIVGCQRCTDTWYGGPAGIAQFCPKCRTPRNLASSFILNEFNNYVNRISEMMRRDTSNNNNNNNSSSGDGGAGKFDVLSIVLSADDKS